MTWPCCENSLLFPVRTKTKQISDNEIIAESRAENENWWLIFSRAFGESEIGCTKSSRVLSLLLPRFIYTWNIPVIG